MAGAVLPLLAQATLAQQAVTPKIIGGEAVTIQQNPWQVALWRGKSGNAAASHHCGGALIHPEWVLTAAHCVDQGTQAQALQVRLGAAEQSQLVLSWAVKRIVVHEGWDRGRNINDIALLHVQPGDRNAHVEPIAGPAAELSFMLRFMPVRVTGWGMDKVGVRRPAAQLQGAELPVVPNDRCAEQPLYRDILKSTHLCLGTDENTQSICDGDSGGPATVEFNGRRQLVGVASLALGPCVGARGYSVFTRVASYADWVARQTRGAVDWR